MKHSKSYISLDERIVRYHDLKPCLDAFIDTRTPGSDKKENFTIIGPGVSENPKQYVHIAEPHGFNIGGARQPPHCVNSQHSHDTAEVFFVHKGQWAFTLGEEGTDARIVLGPGDMISIPTHVFRGFENIGQDVGYLWAILGEDDPGKVMWAPKVFDMAKDYGLVLLENGCLVDTSKGEEVPDNAIIMPITTRAQVNALQVLGDEALRNCCVLKSETVPQQSENGMTARDLIAETAKLNWPHGFSLQHMTLECGAETALHKYNQPDVIFVHKGELRLQVEADEWILGEGDTATVPKNANRQFINTTNTSVEFLRVLGKP